ncbi:MAG TPA: hypothetical protein VK028_03010 [Micromonosporaceae bacterium]|nr:hypothetical protein [Micromonosporaceae bacterium]
MALLEEAEPEEFEPDELALVDELDSEEELSLVDLLSLAGAEPLPFRESVR